MTDTPRKAAARAMITGRPTGINPLVPVGAAPGDDPAIRELVALAETGALEERRLVSPGEGAEESVAGAARAAIAAGYKDVTVEAERTADGASRLRFRAVK